MYPRCKNYMKIIYRNLTTGSTPPKSFDKIPGPKSLPIIGTLYKYLPIIGEYSFKKLPKTGIKKYNKYGSIVREEIVPGEFTVWIFEPDDIAEIFKNENKQNPERRSHLALLKYRKDRKNVYKSGGLLPTNGEEWSRLRREFQKALSKPQNIMTYIDKIDKSINDFVKLCGTKSTNNLMPLLHRLSLELTCLVVFDASMNSFSPNEMNDCSTTSKLIEATLISNSLILSLDNGPRLWRYFDTPLYKKFCKSQNFMEKIAVEMVESKMKKIKENQDDSEKSLLEIYLKNDNLDFKDIVGMACDMLLAGIDTSAYSLAFALYHLSNNEQVQQKLHEEAVRLIPSLDDAVTSATLRDATYMKAVIKETYRMNPIAIGVGRILTSDIVLSGYTIPAGTNAVTQNQVISRFEKYFSDPDEFKPERWMRDSVDKAQNLHPYLVLPFGHGSRSCISRRLAEQNSQMTLLKIVRAYKLEWKGQSLEFDSLPINKPTSPINIQFTPYNQ
ncbi:hypothetical protein HCN44_003907 [Aphidius gifuensis]|uniref:Cytochrome P450 n=1 Tax=Aphidius gifuensis TaxID=684658 RepID=A0A834XYK4_APHGI|nr:cytochrome P450 302a1, mitochondrial-like [Aphidius gifuensis]KAF7994435.1 hypothetical protein HCN44_003907 [Aphidius gifuensis]